MAKITINNIDYFEVEMAYKENGNVRKLKIYTENPASIESVINSAANYQAEKLVETKLKELILIKISKFLDLK